MNISIEDFNVLSSDLSRRDVQIAMLEMEIQLQKEKHNREISLLTKERDALWEENLSLKDELSLMRTDFENLRFENHWMKQYILLSVERVQHFFSHIRDFTLLSAIKSFVLDMLPPNATPEQIAYTREVMQQPMPEETPHVVNVSGDYVLAKQVGNEVANVEAGATGITINAERDDV